MTVGIRLVSFSIVDGLVSSSRAAYDASVHSGVGRRKLVARNNSCSLMSSREYMGRNARRRLELLLLVGYFGIRVQLVNRGLTYKKKGLEITVTY